MYTTVHNKPAGNRLPHFGDHELTNAPFHFQVSVCFYFARRQNCHAFKMTTFDITWSNIKGTS